MTINAEDEDKPQSLSEILKTYTDQITRIIGVMAASVGVIYAVGFIVINSSLLRVGVLDLSLLRTGYLAAGLAYVFLFSIMLGLVLGIFYYLSLPSNRFICKLAGSNSGFWIMKGLLRRDWTRRLARGELKIRAQRGGL